MKSRSSNKKVWNLKEHFQPTETYNPKNFTMCKEKTQKIYSAFNHPLFHNLHTHEQQVNEIPE
jgi:hypothetical protein